MDDRLVLFWNDRRRVRLPSYRKFVVVLPYKMEFVSVHDSIAFQSYADVIFHLWLLEKKDVFAKHALAVHLLISGDGQADDVRAVGILREIVFLGSNCPIAYHTLGLCYRHGIGVSPSEQESQDLFLEGSLRGCLFSRYNVQLSIR